jgi:nicotinate-nucleotide--dimethylbenzimidazole phosphoribosyltransferase
MKYETDNDSKFEMLLGRIGKPDQAARTRALERQLQLTKPTGSLGRLEELSVWLAGIYGTEFPRVTGKAVIVCAGDHAVTLEGVSAYPSEVTPAMVINFLRGGAAVNAIAGVVDARVIVLDVGVNADLPEHPNLISNKIRRGAGNIMRESAMTREEAIRAILAGADAAARAIGDGANLLAAGDMGIGNTTPSAALTAWFTGLEPRTVTGRGTGADDTMLEKKIRTIELTLERLRKLEPKDALEVLAQIGGLEIAAMAGIMLECAASRIPVVIDGYIAGAAALVASKLEPKSVAFMTASHVSQELGHIVQLRYLKLEPLFDYGLRLGEGTGALLAFPVLEAAARTLSEMATFAEASVPDRE